MSSLTAQRSFPIEGFHEDPILTAQLERTIRRMSSLPGGQHGQATVNYLLDLEGPVSMNSVEHFYRTLFKGDRGAVAAALSGTQQVHSKLLMKDRLRAKLEAKRR